MALACCLINGNEEKTDGNEKAPKDRGFIYDGHTGPECGAFNQDRTGDLILTMDALYLLSYKGMPAYLKHDIVCHL